MHFKKFKKNEIISVKIIDVKNEKIKLSKRALEKDPYDWFKENKKCSVSIKKISIENVYHHFGIYLYKFSALKKFVNLKKSKNETKERLEQLRAIDNNMKINVLLANYFSVGIDTKKDLDEYIKLLNK